MHGHKNQIAWTGKRVNQKTKKADVKEEMLSEDTNTKQKTHYGMCELPTEAFAFLRQH